MFVVIISNTVVSIKNSELEAYRYGDVLSAAGYPNALVYSAQQWTYMCSQPQ